MVKKCQSTFFVQIELYLCRQFRVSLVFFPIKNGPLPGMCQPCVFGVCANCTKKWEKIAKISSFRGFQLSYEGRAWKRKRFFKLNKSVVSKTFEESGSEKRRGYQVYIFY